MSLFTKSAAAEEVQNPPAEQIAAEVAVDSAGSSAMTVEADEQEVARPWRLNTAPPRLSKVSVSVECCNAEFAVPDDAEYISDSVITTADPSAVVCRHEQDCDGESAED